MLDRINCDRHFLLLAQHPRGGYIHMLSERAYLVHNILNFIEQNKLTRSAVTIYELRQINEEETRA